MYTGDQDLVVGNVLVPKHRPFVRMTWIGGLEKQCLRFRLEHDRQQPLHRHVVMARAFVISPAYVHANAVRRHVSERMVQHLDMARRQLLELLHRSIAIHRVTPHRQIGSVDLQHDSGLHDRLVIGAQASASAIR